MKKVLDGFQEVWIIWCSPPFMGCGALQELFSLLKPTLQNSVIWPISWGYSSEQGTHCPGSQGGSLLRVWQTCKQAASFQMVMSSVKTLKKGNAVASAWTVLLEGAQRGLLGHRDVWTGTQMTRESQVVNKPGRRVSKGKWEAPWPEHTWFVQDRMGGHWARRTARRGSKRETCQTQCDVAPGKDA